MGVAYIDTVNLSSRDSSGHGIIAQCTRREVKHRYAVERARYDATKL